MINKNWFKEHQKELLDDLFEFLKINSISTDSAHIGEVKRCAIWLKEWLSKVKLKSELIETSKNPIVYAESKIDPKLPTLLIYGHYDVQPVDPIHEWIYPPFDPILQGGEIYARGASDDKGQVFYILAAIKAILEQEKQLPINIKLCFEGDEERGSLGLGEKLKDLKEKFKTDYLLTCDFGIPEKDFPAITLGARGLVFFEVDFVSSKSDLHSGEHGGMALGATRAAIQTLAKLWDESGKIAIPGFYDNVEELSEEETKSLYLELDPKKYRETFDVFALANEKGTPLRIANWLRPTIEINGIAGGYTGFGEKTVLPAKVSVKLSCRLVPDQDVDDIVEKVTVFLKGNAPQGIKVGVKVGTKGKAFRNSSKGKLAKVVAQAYEKVFNKKCGNILAGGSVYISGELAKILECENVLIGLGLPDDHIHAPNEHFSLDRLEKGFYIITKIVEGLKNVEKVKR